MGRGSAKRVVQGLLLAGLALAASPGQTAMPDPYGIQQGGAFQDLSVQDMDVMVARMKAMGARWLRFDMNWNQIQRNGPTSFNWSRQDKVMDAANKYGLQVVATLDYTPAWTHPGRDDSYLPPDNPQDYANFVTAAVNRYKVWGTGGIRVWEIWNEPNNTSFWHPAPDAAAYTALLKAGYAAVKQADPGATVLAGATSPAADVPGGNIDPRTFLTRVYANGGKNFFDAVSHHPYTFPYPASNTGSLSSWYQMFGTTPSLRGVMIANGDGHKKIWGTEYGFTTGSGSHANTEADQAAHTEEAYRLWAGYDWAGVLFIYDFQDPAVPSEPLDNPDNYHGVIRGDGTAKPVYDAYRRFSTAGPPSAPRSLRRKP